MEKRYSFSSNLLFLLKGAWKSAKSVLFYSLVHVPVIVLIPLTSSYLTRDVVSLISEHASLKVLLLRIGWLLGMLVLLNILNMALARKTKVKGTLVRFNFIVQNTVKTMDTDYENIESPDAQSLLRKASDAVDYSNSSMTQQIFRVVTDIASNMLGLFFILR